ncbi:hypothetical protein RJ640_017549 [Escallonia rubra]|uniref:Uncharacterized protein n=1 Tax=Escallonia rubra TaxID=112253 RepID=A0AA88RRV2_9ASTE|nr:hypothetical protein RJ640_017549 [Escallonia rubra]
MKFGVISGTPLHLIPFQGPVRHNLIEPLYKKNWGDPIGSILNEYSPVPGSLPDFQDVKNRVRPVLLSNPSFMQTAANSRVAHCANTIRTTLAINVTRVTGEGINQKPTKATAPNITLDFTRYQMPKYQFLELPSLKKASSNFPLADTKLSPSLTDSDGPKMSCDPEDSLRDSIRTKQ